MKYISMFSGGIRASQVALGCMRIANLNEKEADRYVLNALENGYNYFDHADIYGGGKCEEVFGGVLRRHRDLRDRLFIQTKCGIGRGMYDFSKEHILTAVDGSLKRLGVERIDVLLLHRPDLLMEPEEVAEAFDELEKNGKVAFFGVSNHNPAQIELLQKFVRQKLAVNQMQLSITNATMISSGANVNTGNGEAVDRDGYLRDYCRLKEITIQPWSPLQHGFFDGPFLGNAKFEKLNETIRDVAKNYGMTDTGAAIAWLLRLPDRMQPVVGSVNLQRLREISVAADMSISASDWYRIYLAAGYPLP